MSVIRLREADCKNCYKCIRACPVKSITVKDEQAKIMDDDCILCGECLLACHQNAKTVRDDIWRVKQFLRDGDRVVVSLAPSFVAAFDYSHPGQVVSALKALGFHSVQETAIGALNVSNEYKRLLQEGTMDNIITTCCPTINLLVEKYYPELIHFLAPVITPMLAHGKMIKHTYGWDDTKVVFIGPCISKKEEAVDHQTAGAIDAVLTFNEVLSWLEAEGIEIEDQAHGLLDGIEPLTTRSYPIPMGVIKSMDFKDDSYGYHITGIDGIEQCKEMLDALKTGELDKYFIEMNSCLGGCLRGPSMPHSNALYFAKRQQLVEYAREQQGLNTGVGSTYTDIDMYRLFIDKSSQDILPDERDIQGILSKLGKFSREQELNCGSCGYPSCREKAIAVYQGKAELYMCLPYMRERAESLSNAIISAAPNVIMALDEDLEIQELNAAGERMFSIPRQVAIGKKLYELIDTRDFEHVLSTHEPIINKKVEYVEYGVTIVQTIVYVEEQDFLIAILRDVTKEERQAKRLYKMRMDTVDMAQEVIDKQMRVAQEIASLLGETTAETKVTLTGLKDLILYNDNGED